MATRVKKQPSTVTKEVASPQTSFTKNETPTETSSTKPQVGRPPGSGNRPPGNPGRPPGAAGIAKKLAKKGPPKKVIKKTVPLKATAKQPRKKRTLKINPKNLARALLENGKDLEPKQVVLLKNGLKPGRKPRVKKIKQEPPDELPEESPPVLEPIFPQEENVEVKKTPKKRGRKPMKLPELIDVKKIKKEIKTEPPDELPDMPMDMMNVPDSAATADGAILTVPKIIKRKPRQRKPKPNISPIDGVMTDDLPFIIKPEQIKKEKEPEEPESDSNKNEIVLPKPKRITKKQRLELLKSDLTKKENIENTLSKLDPADTAVIDRLDLNVQIKTEAPLVKRRHSIEKFPVGSADSGTEPLLSVFNQLPRCISPKSGKRGGKVGLKRASPYSTRSDSPARILRNGKHRKHMHLFDGLENVKRRRRLASDLSGSETASKFSEYDSDSSFSDLASLHGSEKDSELSKMGAKESENILDESSDIEPKSSAETKLTKPTLESSKQLIDTNSNVCGDISASTITLNASSTRNTTEEEDMKSSPSAKVPEKGLLLDIMKQTFNDKGVFTPTKCEVSRFYGGKRISQDGDGAQGELNVTEVPTEKTTQKAETSTADQQPELPEEQEQLASEPPSEEEVALRQILEDTAPKPIENAPSSTRKSISTSEDFLLEDKEEEQDTFKNIVQGCIDSIGNISPEFSQLGQESSTLANQLPNLERQDPLEKQDLDVQETDKDDTLPVIDNMMTPVLHHHDPETLENLEPPHLESSVPEASLPSKTQSNQNKKSLINDHNLHIAVTEKDNVVSFSIEHFSDDTEEHEHSNECSSEGNRSRDPEHEEIEGEEHAKQDKDVRESIKDKRVKTQDVAKDVEEQSVEEEQVKDTDGGKELKEFSSQPMEIEDQPSEEASKNDDKVKEVVKETAVTKDDEHMETDVQHVEKTEQLAAETENESHSVEDKQKDIIEEAQAESTEEICDKTSENTEVDCKESVDDNKSVVDELIEESPEELAKKESILGALGLQSLRAVKPVKLSHKGKAKAPIKGENYTGTLKTVIKINKKKGKSSFKMTLQKSKIRNEAEQTTSDDAYKIMKEGGSSSTKHNKDSSDSAGAHRKSHYSNRSNMEGSSEQMSDGEQPGTSQDKKEPEKDLVIPEKASSFSIHPGRLCKDECSYCFGKFGLFDTPCHIAQMKSVERQNKILEAEKHLTRDSCLCDACYRHVDRKSNSPSYINKSLKRNSLVAPGPKQNHCHVLGCNNVSNNILRRKWIIKMKKSICQVINIDLDNPGLHSIPICDEHYSALEHLMVCGMCKRRLARNHIHYLGPEVGELNEALNDEGIAIILPDKPVVCKLCKCFASIILKDPEERAENSANFFREYKKRLLHFNNIEPMDADAAEEPLLVPGKSEKSSEKKELEKDLLKRKKRVRNSSNETVNSGKDSQEEKDHIEDDQNGSHRVPSTDTRPNSSNQSRAESPEDEEYSGVDYNALIPSIALECPSDNESKKDFTKKVIGQKKPNLESLGNAIEISRTYGGKVDRSNDLAAQKLGQNPSISLRPNYAYNNDNWDRPGSFMSNSALSVRQLFPGEEELPLRGHIDFKNSVGKTPDGWDQSVVTIQYDKETKRLWQELEKPYGNKSSFLRHLILLEKYFRNGDLVLSPSASHHAINYRESVQNRLRAYDNIPYKARNVQPISMIPFNKTQRSIGYSEAGGSSNNLPPVTISQIGKDEPGTSSKTPITLQQLNQPPLLPTSAALQQLANKGKSSGAPPGLISLLPGTTRPMAPTVRPQFTGAKIKFPITKNWRPNLIPIDPSKRSERKAGLVQVISGGKPYHITLEDYKKMCAIKRSFEAKQKKLQEQQLAKQNQLQRQSPTQQPILVTHNSVLKSVVPKKGLVISKTSGGTVIENKSISLIASSNAPSTSTSQSIDSSETILEKLDKQIERLGQNPEVSVNPAITLEKNPSIQILPRIPKSLTIVPQTVRRSGPPSPELCITPKISSSSNSNSNSSGSNGNDNQS